MHQVGQQELPGRFSLADVADLHRTLIPTLVPQPADWPRVFGRHAQLGLALSAVRRELVALVPDFELGQGGAPSDQGQEADAEALRGLLTELDEAYEIAAQASGPIVGSDRWRAILALADALRDVNDELAGVDFNEGGVGIDGTTDAPLSAPAFSLVRALSSAAARQIVLLAKEISSGLAAEGLRQSPLWTGLRRVQRAAEAVATFGTPLSPLTPSRYAAGRGALQAPARRHAARPAVCRSAQSGRRGQLTEFPNRPQHAPVALESVAHEHRGPVDVEVLLVAEEPVDAVARRLHVRPVGILRLRPRGDDVAGLVMS